MKFTFEICVGTLPSIRTERCKIDIKEQLLYRDLFLQNIYNLILHGP